MEWEVWLKREEEERVRSEVIVLCWGVVWCGVCRCMCDRDMGTQVGVCEIAEMVAGFEVTELCSDRLIWEH